MVVEDLIGFIDAPPNVPAIVVKNDVRERISPIAAALRARSAKFLSMF